MVSLGVEIATLGVVLELMVICIELDNTINGLAQLALDVISTLITSRLLNDDAVYEFEFVPTFAPFFFH